MAAIKGKRVRPPTSLAAAAEWDAQYVAGEWDRLDHVEEIARYMVILGYLTYASPRPSVLDVGCGHGRLLSLLQGHRYRDYLGLDISSEAVRRAAALGAPRSRLEVADVQYWEPAVTFDVIVFNEVLYYARRPEQVFRRALGWLSDSGAVVVSMFEYDPRAERVWDRILAEDAHIVAGTTVTDEASGYSWQIKALRPG